MTPKRIGARLRRCLRIVRNVFLLLLAILVAYAVIGMVLSLITVNRSPQSGDEVTIYLETNGVHADITVPTKTELVDWSEIVSPQDTASKRPGKYIAFGWGSKDFYLNVPTWKDLTPKIALQAVLGLNGTAIHTRYENEPSEDEDCRKIQISAKQYEALVAYIQACAQKSENGSFNVIVGKHYGSSDAFYEANGRYSPFFTCNTWANSALKACGQKCCWWTPLQQPIFWKYPLKKLP